MIPDLGPRSKGLKFLRTLPAELEEVSELEEAAELEVLKVIDDQESL